ncbi:disintegrin and metalloproteinase domain-containing protein 18-like [Rhinatrema bivittatum]|uniref:disintegrin and metalloproteinase domain-containing protein 18-like n=1 Tax=Rhinatrema bivittatum TaxID=194408 RepID=UPI0011265CFA|nr:disintegrin and metalloproteinase domain-containing protein 18-like [Rhinatrema bivittatum]
MNKQWLLRLAQLSMLILVTLIHITGHDVTSKIASYEVTIPKKLEPKDGREVEGYMSYAIKVEGRTYIMHLAQNRASLSPNFTVFTYNDEGEVLVQQPYIRDFFTEVEK